MQAHAAAKPFTKSDVPHVAGQPHEALSDDQQQAFAKTFQSWRQQNATR
jgi:hypothetical protein